VPRCECGNWFTSEESVKWCRANAHGRGVDAWNSRRKLINTIETEISVECMECSTMIRAEIKMDDGQIRVIVLPHICPAEEPGGNDAA